MDVLLKEDASVDDVLKACVHAYYVRRAAAKQGWRAPPIPSVLARYTRQEQQPLDRWLFDIVEETHRELHAEAVMEDVMQQIKRAGWLTDSIFFPHTQNRAAFEYVAAADSSC